MELLVSVDEADVSSVAEGQQASFTVDAWPGHPFSAKVVQVRYGADALAGVVTYGALLLVDNPERRLRPGMTATADITVKKLDDALLVPNAALRFEPPPGGVQQSDGLLQALMPGRRPFSQQQRETREKGVPEKRVYKLERGALEQVPVQIGSSDGIWSEVTSGKIAAGDALAVDVKAPAS